MNGPQTRVEPLGRASSADALRSTTRLPKHPGVAALEQEAAARLPFPGMKVIHGPAPEPDIALFTPEDAEQALRIYDAGVGNGDRHAAILHVMLHALRCAAINLDVRAE